MSKLKKVVAATLMAAFVVCAAPPADAAVGWQDKAWGFVKSRSPEMASMLGRSKTLKAVQRDCGVLRGGDTADVLVKEAEIAANDFGSTFSERVRFQRWGLAVLVAASQWACPEYRREVWVAINS